MSKGRVIYWAMAVGVLAQLHVSSAEAYEGRLLDAAGKPVADAWVIGQWTTGGGLFAHGGSGCKLAVTRTNKEGRFTLVNREGLFGWLLPETSRPDVSFYKGGVRQRYPGPEKESDPFVMELEDRATRERLKYLSFILARTDCGTEYTVSHKVMLLPLYKEIHAEAQATNPSTELERNMVRGTAWPMLIAELGYEQAARILRGYPRWDER